MNLDTARIFAAALMGEHGLGGWQLVFNRRVRELGSCSNSRRTIYLNQDYVERNSEADVVDTILHEIAHALTPGDGHGPRWITACCLLGANPSPCQTADMPEGRWVASCPCGTEFRKHRRPRTVRVCRRCRTVLEFRHDEA